MPDLVAIDRKDGVADVRLNRPGKYNALSPEMFGAITEAGESLMDSGSRAGHVEAIRANFENRAPEFKDAG